VANIKRKKERLLGVIDALDIKAEIIPLSSVEREELKRANDTLNKLRHDEEKNGLKGLRSNIFRRG
jgi:hypothetical protein